MVNFVNIPQNENYLHNSRLRFLVADNQLNLAEMIKIEEAGIQFFSDSFFFDIYENLFLVPMVGKKQLSTGFVNQFKNDSNIQLSTQDLRFTDLESMSVQSGLGPDFLNNDEFLALIDELLANNSHLKNKKLLVELNSKDLALHFFN